jgi:YD repeat-containing protein
VHRANELAHLTSPAELYDALGLGFSGSQFSPDDDEVYLLRWPAHRANLYRIPYGGQHEAAMRAMQGWVIERAPFRGNGFAPSEGRDVIAEFKIDSTRLPHGAQLWQLTRDGEEKLIALFDADGPRWRRVSGNLSGK